MRNTELKYTAELITEECCNCGIAFAMPQDFRRRRINDHESFFCPRGHAQSYNGKSEAEKLKDELEQYKNRLTHALSRENEVTKKYDRLNKRVKNGVCPCCNRTFIKLAQHIKSKHPNYGKG